MFALQLFDAITIYQLFWGGGGRGAVNNIYIYIVTLQLSTQPTKPTAKLCLFPIDTDLHNVIKKGSILKDIHKRYIMYQVSSN